MGRERGERSGGGGGREGERLKHRSNINQTQMWQTFQKLPTLIEEIWPCGQHCSLKGKKLFKRENVFRFPKVDVNDYESR